MESIVANLQNPEIFSDINAMQNLAKKQKILEDSLVEYKDIEDRVNATKDYLDIAELEDDNSIITSLDNDLELLEKDVKSLYLKTLLKGEYDQSNAIVKIHSGAGGTEACDWVEMLFKMYQSFANKNKFKCKILDYLDGDGAGFKSITFTLTGDNAYGYMKGEMGVHRLVRISPFDANKRRHTSFASVEVIPEIDNNVNIKINPEDIRITHFPTGIVVTCQNERSQTQNKEMAMKMLVSKLTQLEIQKQMEEANRLKGDAKKIEWGSQIRSYVFCPYTLAKDLRTGYETSDIMAVMNGEIQGFIESYLIEYNV